MFSETQNFENERIAILNSDIYLFTPMFYATSVKTSGIRRAARVAALPRKDPWRQL